MKRIPIVIAAMFFLPAIARAWGGDGHQLVALIAEDHLSSQAKSAIHELLGKDVNISDAEIASWADEYRRERRETGPWHYVDIPTDAQGFDEKRDGNNGNNVIDKLNEFEKVLADKNAKKEDRVQALKFVVHLVGDLHQPLHCAERNKDKGGNARLVFFLNEPKAENLHRVWDSSILLHRKGTMPILEYSQKLNSQITKDEVKQWRNGTTQDWANESHQIAVDSAYADVPADGPPPKLGKEYVEKNADVIEKQLEKGGIRLARVLNLAFK